MVVFYLELVGEAQDLTISFILLFLRKIVNQRDFGMINQENTDENRLVLFFLLISKLGNELLSWQSCEFIVNLFADFLDFVLVGLSWGVVALYGPKLPEV